MVEKVYDFESMLRLELFFLVTRRILRSVSDDSNCVSIFFFSLDCSVAGGECCNFVTAVIVRSTGIIGFGSADGRRPSGLVYIELSISAADPALADRGIADRPKGGFGAARAADTICRGAIVAADVDRSLFAEGLGRSLGADLSSPTEAFRNLMLLMLLAIFSGVGTKSRIELKRPSPSNINAHERIL